MTVTNRPTGSEKKLFNSQFFLDCLTANFERGRWKFLAEAPSCATAENSYTPVASDTTTEKGAGGPIRGFLVFALFLSGIWFQGKEIDAVLTATSYFDPVWNAFSKHTDGSIQWIPKKIGNPASESDAPNRRIRVTLVFDMLCTQ